MTKGFMMWINFRINQLPMELTVARLDHIDLHIELEKANAILTDESASLLHLT